MAASNRVVTVFKELRVTGHVQAIARDAGTGGEPKA